MLQIRGSSGDQIDASPSSVARPPAAVLAAALALALALATPRPASAQYGGYVNALGVKVVKRNPGTPAVTIVSVAPGSPGAQPYYPPRGGTVTLARGDAIFEVNNRDINSVAAFDRVINAVRPGETVYIRGRDGQNGAWFDWQGTLR